MELPQGGPQMDAIVKFENKSDAIFIVSVPHRCQRYQQSKAYSTCLLSRPDSNICINKFCRFVFLFFSFRLEIFFFISLNGWEYVQ